MNQQHAIRKLAQEISKIISNVIDTLQSLFSSFSLGLKLEKDYLHKIITTLVSPVQINTESSSLAATFDNNMKKFPFLVAKKNSDYTDYTDQRNGEDLKWLERNREMEIERLRLRKLAEKREMEQMMELEKKEQVGRERIKNQIKEKVASKKQLCTNKLEGSQSNGQQKHDNDFNRIAERTLSFKAERMIVNWIRSEIYLLGGSKNKKRIHENDVYKKALEIRDNSSFKPNDDWLDTFIERFPCVRKMIARDPLNQ